MENHAGSSSRRPNQAHEPGFNPNDWLTLGIGTQERQAARQTHACLYCPVTFLSSQALGEHQQWHWKERERREYAVMFPPTHVPIIPMFGPIVQVEPPPGLDLSLGLGAGAGRMNPVAPNVYPGLLERRLGIRVEEGPLGRMDMVESAGGDDDVIEETETCTEPHNMHGGNENGDGYENEEGGDEVSSKELDLNPEAVREILREIASVIFFCWVVLPMLWFGELVLLLCFSVMSALKQNPSRD